MCFSPYVGLAQAQTAARLIISKKRFLIMAEYTLGKMEMRFAQIIWANAPLSTKRLVELSEQELTWKKSTTYTILRRLCDRNIFKLENGMVTVLMPEEQFMTMQSQEFVRESFNGSLPKFLTAFTSGEKLSENDIAELEALIEESRSRL
jgi:predicted transcriptional regulator